MSLPKVLSLESMHKLYSQNVTIPCSSSLSINLDITFNLKFFPASVKYQAHFDYIDNFCFEKPIILYTQQENEDRGYIIVAANLSSIAGFLFHIEKS